MKQNVRLKRERELRGWSQARVAEELGTDPVTVGRWERGQSFPYPYFREKLCRLFGKNADELGLVQDNAGDTSERFTQPLQAGPTLLTALSTINTPPAIYDPTIPYQVPQGLTGRDALLQQLTQRLCHQDIPGIIALNGLPGVGKTALAAQLAHAPEVRERFTDGILWAGLGPAPNVLRHLSRWGILLEANTDELEQSRVQRWVEAIHFAIGTRRFLLVIDDVWELETALAFKVGGPQCAMVVTTRFPHIALDLASDGVMHIQELNEVDGLTLLQHFVSDIVIDEPQAAQTLVRSVGGLPLALTLMGKYLRVQSHTRHPRRIYAAIGRLQNAQQRLELSMPYAPVDRHTSLAEGAPFSLHSVIAVSDLMLDQPTQTALRVLSLFPAKPNTFSEEAAMVVGGLPYEMLDTLTDAGLLESWAPDRYTLHQTIADYARMHIKDAETCPAYARFARYFVDYARKHMTDYAALEPESGNILAALEIAFEQDMPEDFVRGVAAFVPFLLTRGMYTEAELYVQRAYRTALVREQSSNVALMQQYLGEIAQKRGDYQQAEIYLRSNLHLVRALGDGERICTALVDLGIVSTKQGQHAQAETHLQAALELARTLGKPELISTVLLHLGTALIRQGKYEQAEMLLQQGVTLARQLDKPELVAFLLLRLSDLARSRGDTRNSRWAEPYIQEGLELAQQIGHRELICSLLISRGCLEMGSGHFAKAEATFQEALVLARQLGQRELIGNILLNLGWLANQQGNYTQTETYLQEGLGIAHEMAASEASLAFFEASGYRLTSEVRAWLDAMIDREGDEE
jgi:tetratricopeptide (TPR) repeat protein/transcriptional regulator with XRE-family HTH domain